jgi:hypothetical protein
MTFKVFISHKNEDSAGATALCNRLKANGVDSYVDVLDPDAKDGPDLADYLREKLKICHGLVAVVTAKTNSSWWVPWEIGVASERDMPLATFSYDQSDIPSYLKKWPYLTRLEHIDQYAKIASSQILTRTRVLKESNQSTASAEYISGSTFNRALKKALGQ